MLKATRELFWPILEKGNIEEIRGLKDAEAAEIAKIMSANFETDAAAAQSIASKIFESEEDRGKSAETKSFYFLLVALALMPLLTYLVPAIWDGKFGPAPKWLTLSILIVAVLYLISAAYWALRAISVRSYHTLGASELASIWSSSSPVPALVKEILTSAIRNQAGINDKVSAVKMASAFLLRAIWGFGFLVLVQAGWQISILSGPYLRKLICG